MHIIKMFRYSLHPSDNISNMYVHCAFCGDFWLLLGLSEVRLEPFQSCKVVLSLKQCAGSVCNRDKNFKLSL